MPKSLFPAGFIIDQPEIDLEMMRYHSYKWGVEREQIEKGLFSASLSAVHTPNIQLGYAFYSHGVMRKGGLPTGTVLLGFIIGKESSVFQNSKLFSQELLVIRDGDEMDILSNTKNGIFVVVIEKELFQSAFYNYFARTLDESLKDKRFIIETEKLTHFTQGLSKWLNYLQSKAFIEMDEKPYDEIESAMIRHIFNSIVFENRLKKRHKFQVKRIRDILHENINADVSIIQLVKELDISERQLHNAFRSSYGLSPKKYFQSLRLNAVRKELLSADSSQMYLSDIAYKYGFAHMSHFTHEYKKMFAELPSKTLQMCSPAHVIPNAANHACF